MPPGTYTLVLAVDDPAEIRFGAAGRRRLDAGALAYVGSAFGPGGLEARIARHREVCDGMRDVRHWHVDHVLGHPATRIADVVASSGRRIECEVARRVEGEPVPGLGASDCGCGTHLVWRPDVDVTVEAVREAHGRSGGFAGAGRNDL